MSKQIEEEVYEPEEIELTADQEIVQQAIDRLNNRLAQGFNNLAEAINSIMNQYSQQAQISIELLRGEFGIPPSPEAVEYKALMDAKTEEMMNEMEQQNQARQIAEDALNNFDPTGQGE